MEFDQDHKVKWWLINKTEAEAFLEFLKYEKERHQIAIEEADETVNVIKLSPNELGIAAIQLYESAIKRHEEDIRDIDQLIQQVKHWHQI